MKVYYYMDIQERGCELDSAD